jgi:3,4-dihydroxy 2-butanone 4-phosphate synthase/GTP cyclohydrolase II
MAIHSAEEIIEDIRQGKMVVLMDDEDRENEGDIIVAAEKVTPEIVNFMAKEARGLICLTLQGERCDFLGLPQMVDDNSGAFGTPFTVSIEAAEGVTTGISAADRARTIQMAVSPESKPSDIVQPGHIFPLRAQPGGVLSRAGHTEAGCDLARIAGLEPAAAIVEIMNEDGTMARRPELEQFAEKHNLKIGTIADLIHYRIHNENTVELIKSKPLHTEFGEFTVHAYQDNVSGRMHMALTKGDIEPDVPAIVRVHVPDIIRDLLVGEDFEQLGWPMYHVLEKIAEEGKGVLVILNLEGASDPEAQMKWFIDDKPSDPPRSAAQDSRGAYLSIGTGAQILRDLGVRKMRLLSSKARFNAISGFDLEITEYIPYTGSKR